MHTAEKKRETHNDNKAQMPRELLNRVIGDVAHKEFGQPFIAMYEAEFPDMPKEGIIAAAYCCTLFLSVIISKYPSSRLHTFVHNADNEWKRISFNCNRYEKLYSNIVNDNARSICLIDSNGLFAFHNYSKEDIMEAFDFYTNT